MPFFSIIAGCRDEEGKRSMTGADVALSVFTVLSLVRICAYVPQIVKIWRDAGGAVSISITTWTMFALSHAATAAYALVSLQDPTLTVIFAANATLCAFIVALTAARRRSFRRRQAEKLGAQGDSKTSPDRAKRAPLALAGSAGGR